MNIEIGTIVRSGTKKALLEICGFTTDGKYLARKVRVVIKESALLKYFKLEMLQPGSTLLLPNGLKMRRTLKSTASTWANTVADEFIITSDEEIEEAEAEEKAAKDYADVATRRESPSSSRIGHAPSRRTYRPPLSK